MTLKITGNEALTYIIRAGTIAAPVPLDHTEQRELLEALAHMHGMSLVDREERRSLLELAAETDEDDNQYNSSAYAWSVWQDRCEALASAVTSALRIEDPQEV